MALRCSAPASSSSVTAPPAHLFFPMGLPGSSISATAPPLVAAPLFARAPPLATAPQPATNLIRRRRSPVWLAIWRTWAGFANSQLWRATFRSTYLYMCPSPLLPSWTAAQTDANLSAHLRRLPTPPPYLRRMRLSPGLVRRCWMQDEAAV